VAHWFESLGEDVITLRDDRKRTLYDLRDARRPDGATPAPPRLLPDFDGIMLGWQDRTRMISAEDARQIANRNLQIPGVVLLDGFVGGTWKLERKRRSATVAIRTFRSISSTERSGLEEEALGLVRTFEPDATLAVTFS
jgi:hypothetical protein